MHDSTSTHVPLWSWIIPLLGGVIAALALAHLLPAGSVLIRLTSAALLAGAVFAAVHHAEVLAERVGEPFGAILLAICVTIIEVAVIVSIMLSGAEGNEEVARDTVFSALMIVLNGVIGLCLVVGGRRHHEQSFQLNAASAALAVLGTLATLSLVLPNFVIAGQPQQFARIQLAIIGLVSLVLYGVFLYVQTVRHRDYFMDHTGAIDDGKALPAEHERPKGNMPVTGGLLVLALVAVVLLAKLLSHPLDSAVDAVGLPQAVVGVVIAGVVLLPEGIASIKAALLNRLQNSVNLVLGSALASIGMTVPVVAAISVTLGQNITLGLRPENLVMLVLTLFVSTITLGTGRTTVLQGAVHLSIFVVFLLLSAVP
ncbi:ionic transporter y4hA [Sinorhizobium medicae]|uniref:Calcium/proton exchanger n=1 Tax=Sinorhizobium medicae (strain WSM419) TaxID=366394 RepID=A6UMY3_SINMW|nr:ionic transporter y4hA [Sinorhizobium medicae]ABR65013.1 calcium/proton exchanger [Sinorhizobium medicae WSM419]MBO1944347.1 ionic transporter y4hA [Sinorhizobium medicae]MDX0433408.1 ionic transporter y4hA [Sinorhizobium medicae]MDX0439704.1 ionic transporter y4hA [Sinorhizobium medicae]MDX0458010.1 ionic transporter y4hA [Sinorhizobium medicae]